MKIPKTFLPEKNLEKKVNELSKEDYKKNENAYSENPSFIELSERTAPVFDNIVKIVYGKHSEYNIIKLTEMPDPYNGWIDLLVTDYESERYYCTFFDAKSEEGIELKNKFLKSYKSNNIYDFKPHKKFGVKGKLVKEGYTNDFWWFVLKADEVHKKD